MESLNEIFAWLNDHPGWGGAVVFLIAFFESLALVGLILPGAAMMFGIGALVGTGILPLGPTLLWAALGAIAGDGVSFWLGRHYHMRLKTLWPLRNHPELIAKATRFFHRHGGKSILFGRFIGTIRPIIPAVAGMLEMPTRRFLLFNIISGILWAPVYVLPGMLFTTSLGLAAEVTSRLAILVGSILALLVIVLWLLKLGFDWFHRNTYPLIQQTLWWARLHPIAGRIPSSLLDPSQPEARGLSLSALALLAATILFGSVLTILDGQQGLISGLNSSLQQALNSLRTSEGDQLMGLFAHLASTEMLLALFGVVFLTLLLGRHRHALLHWLAATAFSLILGLALYWLGHQLDVEVLIQQAEANTRLLAAISCLGLLSILLAREVKHSLRWPIYAFAIVVVLLIASAGLYLGQYHLGAVMGVLSMGGAWVSLLGIGYRHHPAERVAPVPLGTLSLVTVVVLSSLQWPDLINQHQPVVTATVTLTEQQWLSDEENPIPRFRADLRGRFEHPLNLQFSGDLNKLEEQLVEGGWQHPPEVTPLSWLLWLNPQTPLEQMPVLPQVHDGRYHDLILTMQVNNQLFALRLWRSRYTLEGTVKPIWIGSVSELKPKTRGGLTVPRTRLNYEEALEVFLKTSPEKLVINRERTVGRITLHD